MSNEHAKIDPILRDIARIVTEENGKTNEVCPDEGMLAAYVDGGISKQNIVQLEKHLVACPDCMDVVVSLYEMENIPDKELHTVSSSDILRKAKALVKEKPEGFFQGIAEWFKFSFQPLPAFATAVISLLLVVGFFLLQDNVDKGLSLPLIKDFEIVSYRGIDIIAKGKNLSSFQGSDIPKKDSEGVKISPVLLEDGVRMFQGENFTVIFQLSTDSYVYLLEYQSGSYEKLFPLKEKSKKFKKGKDHILPLVWLEDDFGVKELFLISSQEKISTSEILISYLNKFKDEPLNVPENISIKRFTIDHSAE